MQVLLSSARKLGFRAKQNPCGQQSGPSAPLLVAIVALMCGPDFNWNKRRVSTMGFR
jgi:hypothetical protein